MFVLNKIPLLRLLVMRWTLSQGPYSARYMGVDCGAKSTAIVHWSPAVWTSA